jgi:hypothetical protein
MCPKSFALPSWHVSCHRVIVRQEDVLPRPRRRAARATDADARRYSEEWHDMRPSDPAAVAKRFAAVLARGIERADREREAHLARIRAKAAGDEPVDWSPPRFDELSSESFSLMGLDSDITRLVGGRTRST